MKRDDFSSLRHRITITILIAYALSFLFFGFYSFFTFPEKYFLAPFRLRWSFLQALVYFITTLNPVQCTAVLLACSFTAPPVPSFRTSPGEAITKLLSSTVVVLIVFGALAIGLNEGLKPYVQANITQLRERTTVARNYFDLAGVKRSEGELRLAEAYLVFYLTMDGKNDSALEMLNDIRKRMDDADITSVTAEPRPRARLAELDAQDLLEKAEKALQAEDYYTAYYFANLAKEISPVGSTNYRFATNVTAAIQDRLSSFQAGAREIEIKSIFEVKTSAYNDLASNDVQLISRAYYTFKTLTERYPEDTEARAFYSESVAKLSTMAYFINEVEDLIAMPGLTELFFVNASSEDGSVEIVSLGTLINTDEGVYAQDIEVVSFGSDGSLLCRLSAETGKIMPGPSGGLALYMRGVDPFSERGTVLPIVVDSIDDDVCGEILPLSLSGLDFEFVSHSGRDLKSYHLNKLYNMMEAVANRGYPEDVIQAAFLARISSAFGIIILSLLALAVGWRLRSPTGRPSIGGIIFIPSFPFIAYFIIQVYEYLHRLAIGAVLIRWDYVVALIVLVVMEFLLLAASILILTTQSVKIREPG